MALFYQATGKKTEADAALAQIIQQSQNIAAFQIAEIYAYRGESEKAFEWLERAYAQRDSIVQMQGQLRYCHLNAHLQMKDVLTKHQTALYQQLRGYHFREPAQHH